MVVAELLETPGFISWLGVTVGDRMYTITAWDSLDDPAALRRSTAHTDAMARFFGPELARGGQTGVWAPHRLDGMWVRCDACGEMVLGEGPARCRCGAALPEPLSYWSPHGRRARVFGPATAPQGLASASLDM